MSGTNGFKVVNRPDGRNSQYTHLWEALVVASQQGQAIEVPSQTYQEATRLHCALIARGRKATPRMFVRRRKTATGLALWLEPVKETA